MPQCLICDLPVREFIDPALAQRDADEADPNFNGKTPSVEALCIQLQRKYSDPNGFSFTLPQLLSHAKNCTRYVKPEPRPIPSILKEIEVNGEKLPVPSSEVVEAHMLAIGLQQMLKHPDVVKPHHLVQIIKNRGSKGGLEDLMRAVSDIIKSNPSDRKGPMAPPDE